MAADEADEVASLFREVVGALDYYNETAKASEIGKHSADALRHAMALDPASALVARSGSLIVGFCLSRDDDQTIWLDWFGVRDGFRGLGVGGMLLDALEAGAGRRGAHKVWCDSRTTNVASARTLSARGYARICTISDHWYRQDFILWEKAVG